MSYNNKFYWKYFYSQLVIQRYLEELILQMERNPSSTYQNQLNYLYKMYEQNLNDIFIQFSYYSHFNVTPHFGFLNYFFMSKRLYQLLCLSSLIVGLCAIVYKVKISMGLKKRKKFAASKTPRKDQGREWARKSVLILFGIFACVSIIEGMITILLLN